MTQDFDADAFRKALGSFATGVAIVTARGDDGRPLGLTVNSFNSVSLSPPLVLWSLADTSRSLAAFRSARHWAVHVLSADQDELSARFARSGMDKFAGIEVEDGVGGLPLLPGCSARFQCRTASLYEGGDHVIFMGEVLAFDRIEVPPLVFHGGRYAHATRRDPNAPKPRSAQLAGSFSEDFVGYLLGRSHFRFFAQIRPLLEQDGLGDMEFYLLSALTLQSRLSARQIASGMAGVHDDANRDRALEGLIAHDLVQVQETADGATYALTAVGRALALKLIAAAKAVESQVLERLGPADAAVLKAVLNRLLTVVDAHGADPLWQAPEAGA